MSSIRKLMTLAGVWMTVLTLNAQGVRETIRLDEGWLDSQRGTLFC